MTFGQFIRKKREAKAISLREFAGRIDIAPAYLSDIEKGNRYAPDKGKIDSIAAELGIVKQDEILELYDLAADSKGDLPIDIKESLTANKELYSVVRDIIKESNVGAVAYREDIVDYLRDHGQASEEEIKRNFEGNRLDFELRILVDKSSRAYANGGTYKIVLENRTFYYKGK